MNSRNKSRGRQLATNLSRERGFRVRQSKIHRGALKYIMHERGSQVMYRLVIILQRTTPSGRLICMGNHGCRCPMHKMPHCHARIQHSDHEMAAERGVGG